MGYRTDLWGGFQLDKPLTVAHREYLKAFNGTRRMKRDAGKTALMADPLRVAVGLPVGVDGCWFVAAGGMCGQDHSDDVLEYNEPGGGQPGLWCPWTVNDDGTEIIPDDGEKPHDYVEWLEYVVGNFLEPWGYRISGDVKWSGEEQYDSGTIWARHNRIKAIQDETVSREPDWGDDGEVPAAADGGVAVDEVVKDILGDEA